MRLKLLVPALLVLLAAGPAYPQNKDMLQLQRDMIDVQSFLWECLVPIGEKVDHTE